MVENIKKVRTQLSEDDFAKQYAKAFAKATGNTRMSRSDKNDFEFNSFKNQGNVKKAAQIAAEEAIKMIKYSYSKGKFITGYSDYDGDKHLNSYFIKQGVDRYDSSFKKIDAKIFDVASDIVKKWAKKNIK